jgi:hypothetical protein
MDKIYPYTLNIENPFYLWRTPFPPSKMQMTLLFFIGFFNAIN